MKEISSHYWESLGDKYKTVIGNRYYVSKNDRTKCATFLERVEVKEKPSNCSCKNNTFCSLCTNNISH